MVSALVFQCMFIGVSFFKNEVARCLCLGSEQCKLLEKSAVLQRSNVFSVITSSCRVS